MKYARRIFFKHSMSNICINRTCQIVIERGPILGIFEKMYVLQYYWRDNQLRSSGQNKYSITFLKNRG